MDARETARIFRHALRSRILAALNEHGEASPADLAARLDAPVGNVSYHTRVLHESGWITLVRVERRRGGRRHVYRIAIPPEIDDATWSHLPVAVRRGLTHETLQRFVRAVPTALRAGGFDADWAHATVVGLRLDAQAAGELAYLLVATAREAIAIRDRSAARGSAADAPPSQLAIFHHALAAGADERTRRRGSR
jgi:hypothetical protein